MLRGKQKILVIAGGGVIGLSIARNAARRGLQVVILEKNSRVGMETSSRNSEVIHAGIYYPQNSLKARLCVQGRKMLYDFCEKYHVPYQKCGKLIVAQKNQIESLYSIGKNGFHNGVEDMRLISREEVKKLEPQIESEEALFSPSTGIFDSHSYLLALQGDAEDHGVSIVLNTFVSGGKYYGKSKSFVIFATQGGQNHEIECDYFVNAIGIFAPLMIDRIVHSEEILCRKKRFHAPYLPDNFAKGNYFKLIGKNSKPFKHLIYPIPEVGGLGVHATLDLQGNVRFGPDVEWIPAIRYEVNEHKAHIFAERIKPYWPDVRVENLVGDYSGIRPKIAFEDRIYEDFLIEDESVHGIPGLVHLCGIESPGLTSSLMIAEEVMSLLTRKQ